MKSGWVRIMSFVAATVAALAFSMADAQAQKRMGGGNSVGKQQSNVSQSTPAGQQAAQRQATPPSAAPQQPQRNKWLAPLAGLAAGIGLAALASHLGFGEELASFMLIALLAVVAIVVIRMIMARRSGAQAGPQPAMAGATGTGNTNTYYAPHDESAVGSGSSQGFGSAVASGSGGLTIPAGFDVAGFERNAKVQFVRLQASFDAANLNDLREFASPEMFAELKMQIDERKGAPNRTEVVTLEAQFLGIESNSVEHMASVLFRGSLREGDVVMAKPFEEIWNLTKPATGDSGWVLAGIQQTQ